MILALIAIIGTLILVVGIHEAGHALAAWLLDVKINRISLGFGRPLLRWYSKQGCEWVWALWPLGGYVQLQNTRISPVSPKEYAHSFDKKPIWMRLCIILAGPLANIITAWFLFILLFLIGMSTLTPQIASVHSQSIAAKAGIMPQDQVLAVGGTHTASWTEVGMELLIHWGQEAVPIQLGAKTVYLDLEHIPFAGVHDSLLARLGIEPDKKAATLRMKANSMFDALQRGTQMLGHWFYFLLMIVKLLLSGVIPFSVLLGPLGLFSASIATLAQGILVFLFFIASLSVAIALVNLIPIPGLDGGLVLYALLEKIRGKPLSIAMEVLLHRLALIGFCVLLVNLLANDLQRFVH